MSHRWYALDGKCMRHSMSEKRMKMSPLMGVEAKGGGRMPLNTTFRNGVNALRNFAQNRQRKWCDRKKERNADSVGK